MNSDYNLANHQGAHLLVFGWNWLGDTAGWGHIKLVLSNKVKSQFFFFDEAGKISVTNKKMVNLPISGWIGKDLGSKRGVWNEWLDWAR